MVSKIAKKNPPTATPAKKTTSKTTKKKPVAKFIAGKRKSGGPGKTD